MLLEGTMAEAEIPVAVVQTAEVTALRPVPVTMMVATMEEMSSNEAMHSVILNPETGIEIGRMTPRDTSTDKP